MRRRPRRRSRTRPRTSSSSRSPRTSCTSSTADGRAPARLFFALVPGAAQRRALAALALEVARETGGRAAHEHNLHLTLAFLGSLPGRRIAELEPIGRETARVAAPFALTLDLLGAFREAGVAWAGPQAIPAELQQMFETLRAALQAAHLPTERRAFHPHVTLVRRCRRGLAPRVMAPLAWQVDALTLMGSDTLPEGPHYRELASWPLAGPGALP